MRLPWLNRRPGEMRWMLGREIAFMLAVKLLLLYGIWSLFFSRPAIDSMIEGMDPERVATMVVAPATTK